MSIFPIVLSGGIGSRLWPLSREAHPKQFLALMGEETLFQAAMHRLQGLPDCRAPVLVCNEQHRFLAAEQARAMGILPQAMLLEPEGRNTAPAVACAALFALTQDPNALLLVLPADHLILDISAFQQAVVSAVKPANAGWLVTFGIIARQPETGYGYIHKGKPLEDGTTSDAATVFQVNRFIEKPHQEAARAFVDSGEYLWNSGLFLLRADTFLAELAEQAPAILAACRQAMEQSVTDLDFLRLGVQAFLESPSVSIDYAVMEKTQRAAVVPMDAGWSDLGSWSAIWEAEARDLQGNAIFGDVLLDGVRNSHVRAHSRLVTVIGLEDVIIVETADAVLAAARERVQDVKALVARLQQANREERIVHRKMYRPWGSYECLNIEPRFLVKRITVNPGGVLSLQKHNHRAEHWVVVKGCAKVTRGTDSFVLEEDQSTYIPVGMLHRLENPGETSLELIEVQSGDYLGEDDIVRYEDQYGRVSPVT
ncbi:MAG: mannose-1-phosphate guanylyltransferase/mannose-6-phosphate isomerase [Magnetococcus sp. YQC-5]